ncbi:hypothetical protein GALMADRAFT_1218153 [Galerina marginata CBS 339.88]|uniref:Uncharacterized protein n=1 Tax=Galerina marginata (strain CBS 339.88) TaxID=685588 RepID=A0A067SG94_GALM3|nr:hypothetical protein GALMADRAFT_1218153 [Galerina marginata CBS 339.88]
MTMATSMVATIIMPEADGDIESNVKHCDGAWILCRSSFTGSRGKHRPFESIYVHSVGKWRFGADECFHALSSGSLLASVTQQLVFFPIWDEKKTSKPLIFKLGRTSWPNNDGGEMYECLPKT